MYSLTTSEVQNFVTTDFIPVTTTANSAANRPINVVMVTTSGANYPNGTFYTKVRGDGTTTAIIKLVISGGAIQEFGDGATRTSMQNGGTGYSFALVDLAGTNIYTDANASTLFLVRL